MKIKNRLVQSIILGFTLSASANTIETAYLQDSILPKALKVTILEKLKNECQLGVSDYGLTEVTSINFKDNDGPTNLKKFRTQFSSRTFLDGIHPITETILVDSYLLDSNNPEAQISEAFIFEGHCQ